jgi:hypothetical protein
MEQLWYHTINIGYHLILYQNVTWKMNLPYETYFGISFKIHNQFYICHLAN